MPKAPARFNDFRDMRNAMGTRQGFERAARGRRNAGLAETRTSGAWWTMRAMHSVGGVPSPQILRHLERIERTRPALTDSPAIRAPDPV
jgi:hypothetical protein